MTNKEKVGECMTEQEAIESLEEINENYFQPDENEFDDINEALNMAIQALETMQELKQRNMTVEDLENYMKFEDECVKKGFSFNSLLEAREKMRNNGWIPCSERLPEDGVRVLTCDNHENVHIMQHYDFFKYPFDIYPYHSKYYMPVAWQPLPEPYKEDGNDE